MARTPGAGPKQLASAERVKVVTVAHAPGATQDRNTFQQTMLGLEYYTAPGTSADLFAQATVQQWQESDPDRYGYLFAQVFESDVLRELSLLEGHSFVAVDTMRLTPTDSMRRLREALDDSERLPPVHALNTAAALLSVSRFGAVVPLLRSLEARATEPRGAFEVAMLKFVLSNRAEDGAGSPAAFATMRTAIASGKVPPDRALDACTQAVVWHLKRKEVTRTQFDWYLAAGGRLVESLCGLDSAAVSSWYRALAMVPAASGDATTTREYMSRARDAAEQTLGMRPRPYELHLLKTYHESSMKEHMFVTKDPEKAMAAGQALLALDPSWSPSYGEVAEAHRFFGDPRSAAEQYERAAEVGPPYVAHHLVSAASCWQAIGDDERAAAAYMRLAHLVPARTSQQHEVRELAGASGRSSVAFFRRALTSAGG